jgi:hypothetical protein
MANMTIAEKDLGTRRSEPGVSPTSTYPSRRSIR